MAASTDHASSLIRLLCVKPYDRLVMGNVFKVDSEKAEALIATGCFRALSQGPTGKRLAEPEVEEADEPEEPAKKPAAKRKSAADKDAEVEAEIKENLVK